MAGEGSSASVRRETESPMQPGGNSIKNAGLDVSYLKVGFNSVLYPYDLSDPSRVRQRTPCSSVIVVVSLIERFVLALEAAALPSGR